MHVKYMIASLLAISWVPFSSAIPLPLIAAGVSGVIAWFGRGWFTDVTPNSQHIECGTSPYVQNGIEDLRVQLHRHLFGQHIVQNTVIDALGGHINNIQKSKKPLVMCFDGTTGTGKNFVSDFIISSLYQTGINSNYVHKYTAEHWIRNADNATHELIHEIKASLRKCPYSLFVFDEMQVIPKEALDSLVALLDYHASSPEYDYGKAIYVFLSNNAGTEITKRLKQLLTHGNHREQTMLKDFERTIETVYNKVSALNGSKIFRSNVIDYYVPFLPLEAYHVKLCIAQEFSQICPEKLTREKIEEVAQKIIFLDADKFQNSGCKRLSKKVEAMCYY